MAQTPGIVLLHGAGLGSWIWDKTIPFINYACLAVDFPDRDGKPAKHLSLNKYVDHLIKQIDQWDHDTLIIAAHSLGGVAGLKLCQHYGSRIAGFAAIGAAIPENGGSFLSCLPSGKRLALSILLRIFGTKPPDSAIAAGLCNDLPEEIKKETIKRFVPESKAIYFEKCDAGIPEADSLYLKLTKDQELPADIQEAMAKNLRSADVAEIESGHLPMLSRPQELAGALNRFAEKTLAPRPVRR